MKNQINFIKSKWAYILFAFVSFFYLTFPMIITFDSAHYMGYVEILERKLPFSTWDIVRGPVFPILIHLSNLFLGKTSNGIVLFSFIFYIIMLFVSIKIIKEFSHNNKKIQAILMVLFLFLVIFNIIVFGYYHTLLTEFVAMTVSIVSCYLSWKLLIMTIKEDRKHYFLFMLYFVVMVPFSWFLKQPYVSITLFPLVISTIISLFTSKPIKRVIPHFAILLLSIVSLFLGIFAWNKILESKGLETDTSRSSFNILGQSLINPLENYEVLKDPDNEYLDNAKFLSIEERNVLNDNKNKFNIVEVYDTKGTLIDQMLIKVKEDDSISSENAIKFMLKAFFTYPLETLNSYFVNYLGIINAYRTWTTDSAHYQIDKNFNLLNCQENCAIAVQIGQVKTNIYYMPNELFSRITNYEQILQTPPLFRLGLNKLTKFSIISLNFSLLILPVVLLFCIFEIIWGKIGKSLKNRKILYLIVILLGYSFLHICAHAVVNATIDRYASPAYITTVLGYLGLISLFLYNQNHATKKSN
ncbi:MAG: hypothetical protein KBH94_01570 [Caldisericia bacterium]|nr:hypothetical protein [Caldisericia bacterium]